MTNPKSILLATLVAGALLVPTLPVVANAENQGRAKAFDRHKDHEQWDGHDQRHDFHRGEREHSRLRDATIATISAATRASTAAATANSTTAAIITSRRFAKILKDVRAARKEVQGSRKDVHNDYAELRKDKFELRRDIRNGASKEEIMKDHREIRGDYKEIADSRKDLRQDQTKLDAARRELKSDLRNR